MNYSITVPLANVQQECSGVISESIMVKAYKKESKRGK